ncbi:MAG: hypothetical protein HY287_04605 [Planctomycetes bacterium]|nr:hypothetical protein [Planctomycetota bacterium]MBI3833595.1 hypothetical protein [Planctomycetota bacterium]
MDKEIIASFILILAAGGPTRGGTVGSCYDPDGACSDPCPCATACYGDSDCDEGYFCQCCPLSDTDCWCDNGVWTCGGCLDFVAQCQPLPTPTGPRGYSVIKLGTLGGTSGSANAINNLVVIAGEANTSTGYRHAFIWQNGTMTDLDHSIGFSYSNAVNINNQSDILFDTGVPGTTTRTSLWRNGVTTQLPTLGGISANGLAINSAGEILGNSELPHIGEHSFLWKDGTITDLYSAQGITNASDINSFGEIVGTVWKDQNAHATLWAWHDVIDIGTLGGLYSEALAINDRGDIAGVSERAPGGNRVDYPFLWTHGKMLDIFALGGINNYGCYSFTSLLSLNNCGEVVLQCPEGYIFSEELGVRRVADLVPAEERWNVMPRGINDRGQIVGSGYCAACNYAEVPILMMPTVGDLEIDGDVDLADFAKFQRRFTGTLPPEMPGCNRADFDGDADVDAADYAAFQKALTGPRN